LINRTVIWRARGDFDRAIADATEAIRLAKAKAPANIMTPPGSVTISAYIHRALAYEAKGDYEHAKQDFNATQQTCTARRRQSRDSKHSKRWAC
jgi:tetratricopeptide (TPR) repeat protein